MDSCPRCEAPVSARAKFCSECASPLSGLDAGQQSAAKPVRSTVPARWLAGIFAATLLGALVIVTVLGRVPQHPRAGSRAPISGSGMHALSAMHNLPAGHPQLRLSRQTRDLIANAEKRARTNPADAGAWDRLGDVALQATAFDPAYYGQAREAFSHVLKLDPGNLDALRGIGNVDFDQRHFGQAIAAYEHYLSKKPNDLEVLTDLGTMYLATGQYQEALGQYKKALSIKPDFFPARFNLAVACLELNRKAEARAALGDAREIAPNEASRAKINQMIAKLDARAGL